MSPDPRPGGVAGVVLAAGRSRRYGSPKQLAILEGRTLLEHVLARADAAGLRPIVVVVPVWLSRPASAGPDLVWVRNLDPGRGISHSLRLGLAALPEEIGAAVILLGDQPTVLPAAIAAVLAARGSAPIVAATAEGHVAPPVLLERGAFTLASALEGDAGVRQLVAVHPELVHHVAVDRHAADVDRVEDLRRLADRRPDPGA